ncbi:MAG TPA: SLC13 family permease [Anaerolineales bacterium]|nr:SLC13 family permease [Anaerolineales bacterium]
MTPAGWITIATIGFAALCLTSGWIRPDLTALIVVVILGLTAVITPEQALSGFSAAAVITVLSIFILTAGLEQTGVTRWIGLRMLKLTGSSESKILAALALTSAVLSLFMNTIAAAAVLLPAAMGIARQTGLRPSRLLMPVAFGSLLGGSATLLTTANIIVSTTLAQAGLQPFGLFDFLPIGIPLALTGIGVMLLLAPRLLPARDLPGSMAHMRRLRQELADVYHLREGTSQVHVQRGSAVAGMTLSQAGWGHELGLTVLGIVHDGHLHLAPDRDTEVAEGDIVLLEGAPTPEVTERYGLRLHSGVALDQALVSRDYPMVEVLLAPRSELQGKTLREIRLRERYGIQALALWRDGLAVQQDIAQIPLRFGDAMLVQGPRQEINLLRLDSNFVVLEEETNGRLTFRAPLSVVILLGSLALAAIGVLALPLAALAGVIAMVLTGCVKMDEAYRVVEWRAVFLIAGMLPLSIALDTSGAATYLGESLLRATARFGPLGAASILNLSAVGLSLLVGGQAAAVILAPIAIAAAQTIGADPRAMAMAVSIGCSLAFITPLGHPANLLVMGPGGYTFRDYMRLGAPLTLIAILVVILGLHLVWGL